MCEGMERCLGAWVVAGARVAARCSGWEPGWAHGKAPGLWGHATPGDVALAQALAPEVGPDS